MQDKDCSAGVTPVDPVVDRREIARSREELQVNVGLVMGYLSIFILLVIASAVIMCYIRHKEKKNKIKVLAARAQAKAEEQAQKAPHAFAFTGTDTVTDPNTELGQTGLSFNKMKTGFQTLRTKPAMPTSATVESEPFDEEEDTTIIVGETRDVTVTATPTVVSESTVSKNKKRRASKVVRFKKR